MPHTAWKPEDKVTEPTEPADDVLQPGPQRVTQQDIRAVLDQLEGDPDAEDTLQVPGFCASNLAWLHSHLATSCKKCLR